MFHADRRSADRRCNARPEDRAGNMRTRGAHRGQEVHAERFPFPTNPTSRLTARTESLLRGVPLCRLALGFGSQPDIPRTVNDRASWAGVWKLMV